MKKEIQLTLFVILGIAVIGGASWYESNQLQQSTPTVDSLSQTQTAAMEATDTTATNTTQQITSQQTMNDLKITDVAVGTGAVAQNGEAVTVNYVGTLDNGTKFDSSYDRNKPFVFTLGVGQVIKGWDMGVLGMKVGGKRELVIPADLGYGASGAGGVIPPNATLHFTVELLAVSSSSGQ